MYLRIWEDKNWGFVTEDIKVETDIEITKEDYDKFFELKGKQFRPKENHTGIGLFDYLEEYIPVIETKEEYTIEDYALDLEFRLSLMELGGV